MLENLFDVSGAKSAPEDGEAKPSANAQALKNFSMILQLEGIQFKIFHWNSEKKGLSNHELIDDMSDACKALSDKLSETAIVMSGTPFKVEITHFDFDYEYADEKVYNLLKKIRNTVEELNSKGNYDGGVQNMLTGFLDETYTLLYRFGFIGTGAK